MSSIAGYVGKRITEERERLGRRITALANAMGRSWGSVSRAEDAAGAMTIETLCQFAIALDVEPAALLPRLADLRGYIGMGGIETLTAGTFPKGEAYIEAVAKGAKSYIAKHGRRPKMTDGDASEHVGFDTTWMAIHGALTRGYHKTTPCGGLASFLDKRKIGQRIRSW